MAIPIKKGKYMSEKDRYDSIPGSEGTQKRKQRSKESEKQQSGRRSKGTKKQNHRSRNQRSKVAK